MAKCVVALGGNAILSYDASAVAQMAAIETAAQYLVRLIRQGYQLILVQGNGPQVGNLLLQQEAADSLKNPAMPLDTCVGMTQGSIGYWLQQSLQNLLLAADYSKTVATLVTQVIVDPNDAAFKAPSKPIGPFYSKEEVDRICASESVLFIEDAGRGYRKVVPSPKPLGICEIEVIKLLVDASVVTICCGGGGIPVVCDSNGQMHGVEAVIDKDLSAALLAEQIEAELLIVLTGVDHVYINYKQENQRRLGAVSCREIKMYKAEGQFSKGSMLPKIDACCQFVSGRRGRRSIISSLENLSALEQGGGTQIINDEDFDYAH